MKKYYIYIYLLIRNIYLNCFLKKPFILSNEKTISEIINNKKSFARFGDGEFRMLLDQNEKIGFQDKNYELTNRLREVLNSSSEKLLIGLTNTFQYNFNFTLDSQIFWLGFNAVYGKKILQKIKKDKIYGDSLITRFYMPFRDKTQTHIKVLNLKKIWDGKELLIIEGENTKLGVGNDLFANSKSINRLICPSKNAFNVYDQIVQQATYYGKDKMILIALGPTATILAHDLAHRGLWAIDIGHVDVEYMWFLKQCLKKSSIEGKSVNEVVDRERKDDSKIEWSNQSEYNQSIINKISG